MPLRERLDACATSGRLSTADLAGWLELPYRTVYDYRRGAEPYPTRRPQIEERLTWLERAIALDPRFPVPLMVRAKDRKSYLRAVRRDHEHR